jgi:hypothetical protein
VSRLFIGVSVLVAAAFLSQLAILLWSHHEFTPAESMIAVEAKIFADGSALYHNPNTYPYTVSPYGIVFYSLSALIQLIGLPPLAAGRLISFLALLTLFWSSWRILIILVAHPYARLTGILLLAVTANILNWGTIGQTDMLACAFSLAAFALLLARRSLWWCGICVLLAVFTKQTAIAEIPAILLYISARNRKSLVPFALGLVTAATVLALTLNLLTKGQYFTNTVLANLNPFSTAKLQQQIQQFLLAAGGLGVVSLAGFRRFTPLYTYTAAAFAIWLFTSPKIGSELNYQIEIVTLLALCSATALDELQFFPKLFAHDPGWVPLLQIPLLLHIVVNFGLTAKIITSRISLERLRRTEAIQLAPYLSPERGRVLSSNFDLLIQSGRPIELDPWFYVLLTNAHRIDPSPLLKDLAAANFGTIILDQNVFAQTLPIGANQDTLFLPPSALAQIRQHYVLLRHVPSPYLAGDYIYQPQSPPPSQTVDMHGGAGGFACGARTPACRVGTLADACF